MTRISLHLLQTRKFIVLPYTEPNESCLYIYKAVPFFQAIAVIFLLYLLSPFCTLKFLPI
jgi:hypothetical protein